AALPGVRTQKRHVAFAPAAGDVVVVRKLIALEIVLPEPLIGVHDECEAEQHDDQARCERPERFAPTIASGVLRLSLARVLDHGEMSYKPEAQAKFSRGPSLARQACKRCASAARGLRRCANLG